MAKQRKQTKKQVEDKPVTLGDLLNANIAQQLKDTKKELTEQARKQEEEEEAKKIAERKLKEKNKSFEELLNETSLNWKDYK